MEKIETKSLPFELKASDDSGIFEGYAAVFGNEDSWGDVIAPGAFKKTLREHKKSGRMPALLWQHDNWQPIGVWESMKEDDTGLYVKGRLLREDVYRAREAYALLKAGALSGMSIGYYATDYETDTKTGVRTLKEIDLVEASLVTFPANPEARVTTLKAAGINTIREFEAALRDVLGFSAVEAKRIASCGYKSRDAAVLQKQAEMDAIVEKITQKYL